jgi:hypothetical protein
VTLSTEEPPWSLSLIGSAGESPSPLPPPKKEDMIHVTVQFLGGRGGECNVVYVGGGKEGGGREKGKW